MSDLSLDDVRELLNYDMLTGVFSWKKQRRGVRTGVSLGTDNGFGYLRITVLGKSRYAHRLAWLYFHGENPVNQIDHINGNKSDNRIENLRVVTCAENLQNKRLPQSNSKSGVLGVSWHAKAGKWQSHISAKGKGVYLGLHRSIESASLAYVEAKRKLHPFNTL